MPILQVKWPLLLVQWLFKDAVLTAEVEQSEVMIMCGEMERMEHEETLKFFFVRSSRTGEKTWNISARRVDKTSE
jgi:hypothetical protein